MSTLRTTNLQHASAASPAIVLASSGSATAQLSSINDGPIAGARNRIINGDMRIDQRNAGAAVTVNSNTQFYSVDRWFGFGQASDGVFTLGRSTIASASFSNSLAATVTTADASIGSGQIYAVVQYIEGFNAASFAWGTASASAVTLSFYVRSSVTGTFGGAIRNGDATRSYPFSYTISSANTFELKTVTIPGDTTGTWATDNTSGPQVWFSLGCGSTLSGTAGSWSAGNYVSATGATNLMATNGATFYITGVQLEPGSVATPYERRSFSQELMLAQRYFSSFSIKTQTYASSAVGLQTLFGFIPFPVQMRATPTASLVSFTLNNVNSGTLAVDYTSSNGIALQGTPTTTAAAVVQGTITASAEL